MGGWEKFQKLKEKKKKKAGGGRGENKVPQKENRDQIRGEKKTGKGTGRK
jgi:hypothetical protein